MMVMSAETFATIKVKIANIYAFVRRNNDIHGKLNTIEFCDKFCTCFVCKREQFDQFHTRLTVYINNPSRYC